MTEALVYNLVMSGSEAKVPEQVTEFLAADLDELMVSLVPTNLKLKSRQYL